MRAGPTGAGSLLQLIRNGDAVTRADLARHTGLARSTVTQRVDALLAHELVYEAGDSESTGGRPPTVLAFNSQAGLVLSVDLGASHSQLAISDLAARSLVERSLTIDIAEGPDAVLEAVALELDAMLAEAGRGPSEVRGVGVGVPGPVAFETGQPVHPPIMPGWDRFPILDWFQERYAAPTLVDNDVNIMAVGEHWAHWRDVEHLLFVKVGTGIGCGIIASRAVHRGARGAAGDIGHVTVPGHDVVCACGNTGCLEAIAGGRALARRLGAESSLEVAQLARGGDADAVQAIREAGRALGNVLAGCVNFFNPTVIVFGGDIVEAGDQLLAGVREVTFRRSLPLATEQLQTVQSRLGDRAGTVGAAIMVIEHVLAPEVVDRAVR